MLKMVLPGEPIRTVDVPAPDREPVYVPTPDIPDAPPEEWPEEVPNDPVREPEKVPA